MDRSGIIVGSILVVFVFAHFRVILKSFSFPTSTKWGSKIHQDYFAHLGAVPGHLGAVLGHLEAMVGIFVTWGGILRIILGYLALR